MAGLNVAPIVIIIAITFIYLVLGCFIDALPLMLLTAPIFVPICQSIGYSPVWFGAYVVVIMGLATVTPPVGIAAYLLAGFCPEVPLQKIFKGCVPFFLAFVIMGVLMGIFPGIATWLPSIIYG